MSDEEIQHAIANPGVDFRHLWKPIFGIFHRTLCALRLERFVIELDTEKQGREFCSAVRIQCLGWEHATDEKIRGAFGSQFAGWILAKRAMLGSAEPVAYTNREKLANLAAKPDKAQTIWAVPLVEAGDIALYAAPPAPVSAEQVNAAMHDGIRQALGWTIPDQVRKILETALYASAPPSSDAKDSERYQYLRMKVCGIGSKGFDFVNLPPMPANWARGSIAQHFDEAIDAAIAAKEGAQ